MACDDIGAGKAFSKRIQTALRAYHRDEALAALDDLRRLHLVQAAYRRQPARGWAAAIRAVLDDALQRLAASDHRAADLLRRHYLHDEPSAQLSLSLGYSESSIYQHLREAAARLAQFILEAEEQGGRDGPLGEAQRTALDALPPPTFSRLFGVEEKLARLMAILAAEVGPWLVAVDGMGGIGKTALALAAAEGTVIEGCFQRLVWITAQQHTFDWGRLAEPERPALTYTAYLDHLAQALRLDARFDLDEHAQEQRLRQALAACPTLLVVDNLETAADLHALAEGLNRLARPSKVLLTTRHRLSAFDPVASLTVRELPPAAALAFLRYHSQERNIPALLAAPEADLLRLVQVTDGNPLAIKLVAGQAQALPLARILDDLAAVRPAAHDFYRFLFHYSWDRLSAPAQHLLLHMPLLDARGVRWEDLAAVSGVALDGQFRQALQELVDFSLLNVGWVRGQLLYSIHRLTENFILSDLVQAKPPDQPQAD